MIGKALGTAARWLFGGSAADTIRATGEAVDAATTSDQERMSEQRQENASARTFAAPGTHGTRFDVLVDGLNRLPRPLIIFYVFGGIVGWWPLADLSRVDPLWLLAGMAIMGFLFGGRLLTKDVPAAVLQVIEAAMRMKRKG